MEQARRTQNEQVQSDGAIFAATSEAARPRAAQKERQPFTLLCGAATLCRE
jgi:hypothetical protein